MQVIFKTTPYTRKFGVELEVSPDVHKTKIGTLLEDFELWCGTGRSVKVTPGIKGWDDTKSNSYWHVKYDSTCGPKGKLEDHGWEIASFIGRTAGDLRIISSAGEWLGQQGISTNDNCGYHIHIDVSDFSPERMGLLIARWLKIEFYVMSACAQRRLMNPYCQFLNIRKLIRHASYRPTNLKQFWNDMSPENLAPHDNADKRYTVNTIGYKIGQLNPIYSRQTVEFRFPECVLNKDHIGNWVRLLLTFVDDCFNTMSVPENIHNSSSLSDVMQIMGLQGEQDFFVLDKELLEAKKWFLQKINHQSGGTVYAKEASDLLAFISEI